MIFVLHLSTVGINPMETNEALSGLAPTAVWNDYQEFYSARRGVNHNCRFKCR
jgi:hypothetical protein